MNALKLYSLSRQRDLVNSLYVNIFYNHAQIHDLKPKIRLHKDEFNILYTVLHIISSHIYEDKPHMKIVTHSTNFQDKPHMKSLHIVPIFFVF